MDVHVNALMQKADKPIRGFVCVLRGARLGALLFCGLRSCQHGSSTRE